jgi:hypothetical protein
VSAVTPAHRGDRLSRKASVVDGKPDAAREGNPMDLDLEELTAAIELLDKADFHYEKGDLRIAVRRGGPPLDDGRSPGPAQPVTAPTTQPASTDRDTLGARRAARLVVLGGRRPAAG